MSELLEIQPLGRRQDASSGSTGGGGNTTFLDLIANPFVAAVRSGCSLQHSVHI